jgi:hypothetical protein
MVEPALLNIILERYQGLHCLEGGLVGVQSWGHRCTPFSYLSHCAAIGPVDLAEMQSLALGHVGAFLRHRTFHKQYHERDSKRQHGEHPKAVEVGKGRCLLLPQVCELLPG